MTATSLDLPTTLEQARNGDTHAFAQIVRQYQSLVSGVLFNATGDFHKSEDIAQETFLIAWQKLAELREPQHLAAWLCTIARNLAHRSHRKPTISTEPLSDETGRLTPAAHSPDAELLRREQSEFVWSAIGEIDEKHRETLVLYYRSGQSVKEIADATESTEEAVRQRLVRARKSLKNKIEEMVGGILTDTAPGEVFTITVMTALTTAMLTTATATAATGTIAAGSVTGGKTLGAATIWTVLGPTAVFGWIFAITFAGLWADVRNSPTLQSRRCRVYRIFWGIQYYALFCSTAALLLGTLIYWTKPLISIEPIYAPAIATVVMLIVVPLSMWIPASFQFACYRKMKRIIENDLGLSEQHVHSYSYQQIEQRFFLSLITNILLAEAIIAICLGASLLGKDYHHPVFLILAACVVVFTVVLTAVYYPLGRYFLEICRTKQNFLAAPPLVNNPFEVALQTIGKRSVSIEYAKKNGGMFGVMLLIWGGLIGCGIYYFTWYSWDKHPVPLAICAVLFVVLFLVHQVLRRRIKRQGIIFFVNVLIYFCIMGLILALEYIEFGGIYFSDAWIAAYFQEPRNPIRHMNISVILVPLLMVPLQFYYWLKAREEPSVGEELFRSAIARYNPATMIADEPEVAAKPFPRHWAWIIGLYGLAIVIAWCVGVLVF
ncbi:MAG: sigma-70 family RNA polymerase sigma factor [Planctomycetaceae bacterium]|nr:sigma-70 family RNA polymerase sigma factor [Planctomycetaceae bacterium]